MLDFLDAKSIDNEILKQATIYFNEHEKIPLTDKPTLRKLWSFCQKASSHPLTLDEGIRVHFLAAASKFQSFSATQRQRLLDDEAGSEQSREDALQKRFHAYDTEGRGGNISAGEWSTDGDKGFYL